MSVQCEWCELNKQGVIPLCRNRLSDPETSWKWYQKSNEMDVIFSITGKEPNWNCKDKCLTRPSNLLEIFLKKTRDVRPVHERLHKAPQVSVRHLVSQIWIETKITHWRTVPAWEDNVFVLLVNISSVFLVKMPRWVDFVKKNCEHLTTCVSVII